jgi:excinuclease ABC subunit A
VKVKTVKKIEQASTSSKNIDNSTLIIRGCRQHNLKALDIDIVHDELIVLTGLSGSGKSSLAFDTVYAEGQRRYLETFSPYVRQFFERFTPPKADLIQNVRPTLAIQQKTKVRNARSTVGTLTHINDLLKVLWSNIADPTCPQCSIQLEHWQPQALAEHLLALFKKKPGADFVIGAPFGNRQDALVDEIARLDILGFERYFDKKTGKIVSSADVNLVDGQTSGSLFIVLSRVRNGIIDVVELTDSLVQAFKMGQRRCVVAEVSQKLRRFPESEYKSFALHTFSEVPGCPEFSVTITPPRPSLFTFNHPQGACAECNGFGAILKVDLEKCIPDFNKTILEGCIVCWTTEGTEQERKDLELFCKQKKIPLRKPWKDLTNEQKELILNTKTKNYWGVLAWFQWLETKKYKMYVRVLLSKYRTQTVCPLCDGARLNRDALSYRCEGFALPQIWEMPISELKVWLQSTQKVLESRQRLSRPIREVFNAIDVRLHYLQELGLPYLSLSRSARTLSGGETQRVNLVNAIGSTLTSTHFILDEPSVGLHKRDSDRLARSIRDLQKRGNSVLVVEHDPFIIDQADRVIELGPKAGKDGGEVVYNGPPESSRSFEYKKRNTNNSSLSTRAILLDQASAHNVQNLSVSIPLDSLVCLTGVSGSGKSTLMHQILYNGFQSNADYLIVPDGIRQVLVLDQNSLMKSSRATVATYTKVWDVMRDLLARSKEEVSERMNPSLFSFNVVGGRCEPCKGAGYITEEMQFLGDVRIPCDVCFGERFQPAILEVMMRGKNVAQWLASSVDEAVEILQDVPVLHRKLHLLQQLGLGHLTLGHSLAELSGGESQRLKLVPILDSAAGEGSVLLFDEPTSGLEIRDVERLIELFYMLKARGNSVICVAHHCGLILKADWVIDMGPEGGCEGGRVVATGTPEQISKIPENHTGKALRDYVKRITRKPTVGSSVVRIDKFKKDVISSLTIKGAKEHNLKNIAINIPLNKLVALVGVSGSGKSTIAKDIIHAESQHQFLSCLSPYARQFVNTLSRPNVESIHGLQPTICIGQHTFQPSALSTVGTVSEVNHYLRLLYAKAGQQYCVDHPNDLVGGASAELIVSRLQEKSAKASIKLLAPIINMKKGEHREVFQRALELEIGEVRVDGTYGTPGVFIDTLERKKPHSIEFVVLSGKVKRIGESLLEEAAYLALKLGQGDVLIDDGTSVDRLSLTRSCSKCSRGYAKPDPEDLSFNSKRGQCQKCQGSGVSKAGKTCTKCGGSRLNSVAQNIKIANLSLHELCQKKPDEIIHFLEKLKVTRDKVVMVESLVTESIAKLRTLDLLGLGYLTLDRNCRTLSGGELQRLRLACALGSPLTGIMYIFDEPSIGLHPLDNQRVLQVIRALSDRGNSVIMIEHDAESIYSCDHVIEIGPGGGSEGGNLLLSTSIEEFLNQDVQTPTLESLNTYGQTEKRTSRKSTDFLTVSGATLNNLHNISVTIPLGALTTVAGVSGAGKSSLVKGVLLGVLSEGLTTNRVAKSSIGTIATDRDIDKIVCIDQKPIGANSRSTPASYLGIWDPVRQIFAQLLQAKSLGWSAKHFSYNTGEGRCSECGGQGEMSLEMSFLPDARVTCSVCQGSRYRDNLREVKFLGRSIDEVLLMTFADAKKFFVNHRKIYPVMVRACDLGLGYLTLGQPAPSLSGGESQRIKLVSELGKKSGPQTLYLLDEPTVGLHLRDISRLMNALHALVDRDSTVIIVEHELEVINSSDYIVELGPGAGIDGGKVTFQGSPQQLRNAKTVWGSILKSGEHRKRSLNMSHQEVK